jgi:hypothetical protein
VILGDILGGVNELVGLDENSKQELLTILSTVGTSFPTLEVILT